MMSLLQQGELASKLETISAGLPWLLPEICLVLTLVLLLCFDLAFKGNKSYGLASIAFVGLGFTFLLLSLQWNQGPDLSLFDGLLKLDRLAILFKFVFVIGLAGSLIIATQSKKAHKDFFQSSEVNVLLFGVLLGSSFMVMSSNLLLIYLSIEVVSICSYALSAVTKGRKKAEAGLKYLIFGAASSAIMLYGMSWLYGFTGTLDIASAEFITGIQAIDIIPLSIAALLTLIGILFKLGAFPMHIWSPDVYEAVPIPIINTFSILPKLAALAILMRLSIGMNLSTIDWHLWLGIIAMASMTVGNFSALWQKDIKRMLAYSSIAHAGFLMVGLVANSQAGNEALVFYGMIYALMNIAAFFLIQMLEDKTGSSLFESFKGKGTEFTWLGILVVIVMVSLTGLPPTAGFNAKLFIFSSLFEVYETTQEPIYMLVLIFGLINTVIALFYYLKLPYYMYLKTNGSQVELTDHKPFQLIVGTLFTAPLLLLFFRSDWFVDLVNSINFGL